MPDLADLYPGFASHWIATSAGRIFARSGGEAPPPRLLFPPPQTHVWRIPVPPAPPRLSILPPPPLPSDHSRSAWLPLVGRAATGRRARALQQARHGRRHDRGHGGARSRALSPRRARPRRPRRLSARARSPRAARTARRARHRADLGHV